MDIASLWRCIYQYKTTIKLFPNISRLCYNIASAVLSSYYFNPNGLKILSLTVLAATSPPLCNANAPIILYIVCASTVSIPLPCRLSLFFGFHLTTLSTPYCVANFASRDRSRILSFANWVTFSNPSRAGWRKTSSAGGFGLGEGGALRRAVVVWETVHDAFAEEGETVVEALTCVVVGFVGYC